MLRPIAILFLTAGLAAQSAPRLLVDLNTTSTGPLSSSPSDFARVGAWSYFTADDGSHGRELFRTGGSGVSTGLVLDVRPGEDGSDPTLWPARTRLFFFADDGVHGREPWISDGTAAGTRLIADVVPGSAGSDDGGAGILDDLLVFAVQRAGQRALWVSDGTAAGTQRVVDESALLPHETSIGEFVTLTNSCALLLWGDFQTLSLWSSDGTREGTRRLLDRVARSTFANVQLTAAPGFAALTEFRWSPPRGTLNLWRTDGSAAGTARIGTFAFFPRQARCFDGRVWVSGLDGELLVTDGTPSGSRVLDSNHLGTDVGFVEFYGELGGRMWGFAEGRSAPASQWLVRIDPGSTQPSVAGRFDGAPNPNHGATLPVGSRFVVLAASGELTGVDPFTRSLEPLELAAQTASGLGSGLGLVYLAGAESSANRGVELYATDGTSAGTRLVADLHPGARGTAGSSFGNFTSFGRHAAFAVSRAAALELWATDGSTVNTIPIMSGLGSLDLAVGSHGLLYFTASSAGGPSSLFATDGTIAGTRTVYTGGTGAHPSSVVRPVVLGSRVLLLGPTDGGLELFAIDGTAIQLLARLGGHLLAQVPFAAGTRAYYAVLKDESPGSAPFSRVWVSDGTRAGTVQLGRFAFGYPYGFPSPSTFTALGDQVYFVPRDPNGPYEIWCTDGTPVGTRVVGPVGRSPANWWDPPVVFATRSHVVAIIAFGELWSCDPATGVISLLPQYFGGDRRGATPTVLDGRFLFDSIDPVTNRFVPHISDGSAGGTQPLVTGFNRTIHSAEPYVPAGSGRAIFHARDASTGQLVTLISDGTANGTRAIPDPSWTVLPPPGMDPSRVTATAGGRLFLGASDAFAGLEPHVLELGATVQDLTAACGSDGRRAELFASLGGSPNGGFAIEGRSRAGALALILLSPPPLRSTPVPSAGACALDVDLNAPVPLAVVPIVNGRFAQSWPLPDDPALYGIQAVVQGFVGPTNAPLGVDFTNGLLLQLGL